MRYSIAFIAPFVAAAYAQSSATTSASDPSVTSSSSYSYSNFETQFLTQTNSLGVVTGEPTAATLTGNTEIVTTQPPVMTSQPAVATIPAGLPTGLNTIPLANGTSPSSFVVSIGSSTTIVLGGGAEPTDASITTSGTAGSNTAMGTGSPSNAGTGSSSASSGPPSSTSPAHNAAPTAFKIASGAVLGLGVMAAALL